MERSLGFGLDDARGEITRIARPIFSVEMRLLVASTAPRRQATAWWRTRGDANPIKLTDPKADGVS